MQWRWKRRRAYVHMLLYRRTVRKLKCEDRLPGLDPGQVEGGDGGQCKDGTAGNEAQCRCTSAR